MTADDIFGARRKSEMENKSKKAGRPKSAKSRIETTATAMNAATETAATETSGVNVINLFFFVTDAAIK